MKQKRKEQPYNARRYWLIFSVLTVLLLIPFRIVDYWGLTYNIYAVISVLMFAVMVRFIRHYRWRKKLTIMLMIACFLLPIAQMSIMQIELVGYGCSTETHGLLEIYECDTNGCGIGRMSTYIGVKNVPINILLAPNSWNGKGIYGLC